MISPKVLFIEDEQDIRTVAEVSLIDVAGWELDMAASGDEGISKALSSPPDVILLDVMMPGRDGPATLKELRLHPTTRDIPVIFITAKVQKEELDRLMSLGALGVIRKPFDPMLLSSEIARLLYP